MISKIKLIRKTNKKIELHVDIEFGRVILLTISTLIWLYLYLIQFKKFIT